MKPILSITIPTYNRSEYLAQCLASVLPQARALPAEVLVIDNASSDDTPDVARRFAAEYSELRYFRNDSNLGYSGNQAKCVEYAAGDYMAILCDDDVYLPGAVRGILETVGRRAYALVALNYCSFTHTPSRPVLPSVGPPDDREFARAYDVIKHPSVGHYSGLVFHAGLARSTLPALLRLHPLAHYETHRGILSELAARSLAPAELPAYYIGRVLMGARRPRSVDYDSLQHLCLDFYQWQQTLHDEGVLSDEDLAHWRTLVLDRLPKALLRNAGFRNRKDIRELRSLLDGWFAGQPVYARRVVPVLRLLESGGFRTTLRGICRLHGWMKPLWWRIGR